MGHTAAVAGEAPSASVMRQTIAAPRKSAEARQGLMSLLPPATRSPTSGVLTITVRRLSAQLPCPSPRPSSLLKIRPQNALPPATGPTNLVSGLYAHLLNSVRTSDSACQNSTDAVGKVREQGETCTIERTAPAGGARRRRLPFMPGAATMRIFAICGRSGSQNPHLVTIHT